ncbi:hypothetical protein [Hyphomicrobium sp.]|uniref:hypothetical protein n=1 Tax=Hyphomicrobium sp. TaxID=82 RepID=UPI002C812B4C|nr:hypothetical protein [Hyphomicrobium sp.]HRN88422.1 hypothetical protein [Hyphomicrobium sp.]HRQ26573.1 hypothetical protein [Hyphomicrobium sp.]
MNIRVKTDALPAESGHKKFDCVLAALGLQAAMPKTDANTAGEHWVASWRFCPN